MNEPDHLTPAERAAYWQRMLAPAALLEVSDHLETCPDCREALRRAQPRAASAEPLSYEDLVAWLDADLDPLRRRELAERIGNSPQSALALTNLLQFRDEMNELPAQEYSIEMAGGSSWTRVWILPLAAGLVLGCGLLWWNANSSKTSGGLALVDQGRTVVVRPDGEIPALGLLPADLRVAVRDAVSLGKVARPTFLRDLQGARETLAGTPAAVSSFHVVAPVASVVEAERPTFRWSNQPGATGYRINLAPQSDGEVLSSPVLGPETTSWTPPEKLSPNETYEWEVEALRDGALLAKTPAPPEPEARFRVLDAAARHALEQSREKWGSSHLVIGLAYARAGLVAPARVEFEQLARENPQSLLPAKLLAALASPPNDAR